MIELRRAPRINVTWRGGVKMHDGRLVMIKVINVSSGGMLIVCPENLIATRKYPMMIEIPSIDDMREIYKVQCKGEVRHCILSGSEYRVGVQLTEMSQLHSELVQAWANKNEQLEKREKPEK